MIVKHEPGKIFDTLHYGKLKLIKTVPNKRWEAHVK